jgi:hypothetical protein
MTLKSLMRMLIIRLEIAPYQSQNNHYLSRSSAISTLIIFHRINREAINGREDKNIGQPPDNLEEKTQTCEVQSMANLQPSEICQRRGIKSNPAIFHEHRKELNGNSSDF